MRALLFALAATACTHVTSDFVCETDADCTSDTGAAGRCEFNQRCSYADTSCASGFRFGGYAGDASNECTASGCTGEVRSGPTNTCVLTAANNVWCWGDGDPAAKKVAFSGGPIAQLDTNGAGVCVRLADGSVNCAGTAIPSLTASDVAVGSDHVCAVTGSGVACWGNNDKGQLGDNSTAAHTTPAPVQVITSAKRIASGITTSCAIDGADQIWCWGDDSKGELGRGICATTGCDKSAVPVMAKTMANAAQIAVGKWFACGVKHDGTAWCWGFDDSYQCGKVSDFPLLPEFDDPIQVPGLPGGIVQITAGDAHACALDGDHQVWCWGVNASHEAAAATQSPVMVATKIVDAGGKPVLFHDVDAGGHHTCGRRDSDGVVLCWGDNSKGQLGTATAGAAATPAPVEATCD